MSISHGHAYAYVLPNPYRADAEGTSTLVLDEPLRVDERITGSFLDVTGPGPEREWEVVAIEHTDRDGEVAPVRGYRGDKPSVLQGRLILRPLG